MFNNITLATLIDNPIFNFVWFYSIWLFCVLGQGDYNLIVVALIIFHFVCTEKRTQDLAIVLPVAFVGLVVDASLSILNVLLFESVYPLPVWLILLWIAFPLTLNRGLKFLNAHPLLPFILGGLGGASSYLAGAAIGSVALGFGFWLSAFILFVHWAMLMPLFMLWISTPFVRASCADE